MGRWQREGGETEDQGRTGAAGGTRVRGVWATGADAV